MLLGRNPLLDSLAHPLEALLLKWISRKALPQFLGLLLLTIQVLDNGVLMIKIIGQAGVNISQAQRRKAQRNFFGGRALLIMVQDRIQTDTGASNPYGAILRD